MLFFSCKAATTYYVVRHVEKESGTTMTATTTMTSDVPLSIKGRQRADALKNMLINKRVGAIYATNTIRAKSTAQPLSAATNIPITIYDHRDTAFIPALKKSRKNVLIVGHSNTVDDIINGLSGENHLTDLSDGDYGDLFILQGKGNNINFRKEHFGK
jgi:broad specificity phosphatase PhoE